MKILSLVNNASGCDYHRIRIPITYMQQQGQIRGVPEGLSFEDSVAECDILFYNRVPFNMTLDSILDLRAKYGFKIVVDIDDYWKLYPGHYLEATWKRHDLERQIVNSLKAADAVICTTERLGRKALTYNDNVHVCPNGLPFDDLQFTTGKTPSEQMRFMYAGGGSHYWDLLLLKNAMEKLARTGFDSEVILAGTANVDIYDRMAGIMGARGKLQNFRTLPALPLDSYMDLYNQGDVAMAPLVANEFNAHKSNLKVLEAGCKSLPIIVSNVGPYADDPCPLLMRVDNSSEWCKWIRFCEDNPSFVQDNGEQLAEYVRKRYDIRVLNDLRLEAFKSVL